MMDTTTDRADHPLALRASEWIGGVVRQMSDIPPDLYTWLVAHYCWITVATIQELHEAGLPVNHRGYFINPPYPTGQPPLVW